MADQVVLRESRRLLPEPTRLPWRRPAHELLLLVLVALAALSVVQLGEAEDVTRTCLTEALVAGRLSGDDCFPSNGESIAHGHRYSNVPPGVSAVAIPVAEAVRLPPPVRWAHTPSLRLWAVRVWSVGIAFVLCAFMVGRVAEGLRPGWGGATLVTFALGTVASAVAPSIFDHAPTAALAFGAFVLAWGRRPLLAGLTAGLTLTFEYQAALFALVIGAYVLCAGARPLGRYVLGLVPGAVLIGAYDWGAFGSPYYTSYQFNPTQSKAGIFGVQLPSLHGTHLVLVGTRGLLVVSPVLALAAYGLVLLWRERRRAEVIVCATVTAALVVLDCGYYLPYGGDSPGPRFVVPALPFLALGLAAAFARLRLVTTVLAVASVVASSAIALTWPSAVNFTSYAHSVWWDLAAVVGEGSGAPIAGWVQENVLQQAGVGRLGSALVVAVLSLFALGLALRSGWATPRPRAAASGTPVAVTANEGGGTPPPVD